MDWLLISEDTLTVDQLQKLTLSEPRANQGWQGIIVQSNLIPDEPKENNFTAIVPMQAINGTTEDILRVAIQQSLRKSLHHAAIWIRQVEWTNGEEIKSSWIVRFRADHATIYLIQEILDRALASL